MIINNIVMENSVIDRIRQFCKENSYSNKKLAELLNMQQKVEIVSKMLGHTDIATTQIYAKVLQDDVTEGFNLLESKIKS